MLGSTCVSSETMMEKKWNEEHSLENRKGGGRLSFLTAAAKIVISKSVQEAGTQENLKINYQIEVISVLKIRYIDFIG